MGMEEFKFLECFSKEDCKLLQSKGHEFWEEKDGRFYLIFNNQANFSDVDVEYKVKDTISF